MPEDGYGWEKLFSERMCRHFTEDFGLETRVARYHNVYGPHGTFDGGREKAPAAICRKVAEAEIARPATRSRSGATASRPAASCTSTTASTGTAGDHGLRRRRAAQPRQRELVTINELVDIVEEIAGVSLERALQPGRAAGRARTQQRQHQDRGRARLGAEHVAARRARGHLPLGPGPGARAPSGRRAADAARRIARSHASASASGGCRSVTARLPAASRSRSSGSRTIRRSASTRAPCVAGIHDQRVLALHGHVADRPGSARGDQRQTGRGALAQGHAERLVRADQGQRVRRGVHVAELLRGRRAREPSRHAEPVRKRRQLAGQRPDPAHLELRLALRQARARRTPGSGRRGSSPAPAARPTGSAPAPPSRAGVAGRMASRSAFWSATSARSGSTPIPRRRSAPCDDATMNPAARGASARCTRSWRPDNPASLHGRELAEDHQRDPVAARPRERSQRCRPVLPAHDAVGPRLRKRLPDAARDRDRGAARPRPLPRRQDLATVTLCVGEPAPWLIPARLARGEVHHVRDHVAALGERTEQRLAVGDRNRRQDRDARRHRRNFALSQGSQSLAPANETMSDPVKTEAVRFE